MKTSNFILTLVLLAGSACYIGEEVPPDQTPWPYRLPAELGNDQFALSQLDAAISDFQFENIKSVVILHKGNIIFENYYGYTWRALKELDNLTTIVTNMAVGIAIAEGLIADVEDSVHLYLPEYEQFFETEPLKKQILVRHLMSHRAGFSWNEGIISPLNRENNLNQMRSSDDWASFVLAQPLEALPGTRHNYNSGAAMILSRIIQNVSGVTLEEYVAEKVFRQIGISNWEWYPDPTGATDASGGLHLAPMDMTRIAYVYLTDGEWKGKEILTSQWVEQSTSRQSIVSNQYHFGYNWWLFADQFGQGSLETNDVFFFAGGYGNHVYVVPQKELVVFIGAQNLGNGLYNPSLYLYFEILNAIS